MRKIKMKHFHAGVGVVFIAIGISLIIWHLVVPIDYRTSSVYLARLLSGVGVLALSLIPFSLSTRCFTLEQLRAAEEKGCQMADKITDNSKNEVYKQISLSLLNAKKKD